MPGRSHRPSTSGVVGHGGGADQVGLGHRVGQVVDDLDLERGSSAATTASARLRVRFQTSTPLDRRPHRAVGSHQVGGQPSGADHQHRRGVGAGEEPRPQGRVAGGLAVRQLGAVDQRQRRAVLPVEEHVERLHGGDGRVLREDGDQLDAEVRSGLPGRKPEEGLIGPVRSEHGPADEGGGCQRGSAVPARSRGAGGRRRPLRGWAGSAAVGPPPGGVHGGEPGRSADQLASSGPPRLPPPLAASGHGRHGPAAADGPPHRSVPKAASGPTRLAASGVES